MRPAVTALLVLLAAGCSGGSSAPDGGNGTSGGSAATSGGSVGASSSGSGSLISSASSGSSSNSSSSGSSSGGSSGAGLCQSVPAGAVSLPADDAQHDASNLEWWYWTGHLWTPDGGAFGFEECFFRELQGPVVGQLVDFALTDIEGQRFLFGSDLALGEPAQVTDGFVLAVGGQTADGGDGHDALHVSLGDAGFDLALDSVKAPVLQGGTGYITYPDGGWTYYYSRELMRVTGSLSADGQTLPVTGEAWFDHQWGNLQQVVQAGWVWMSIQLDDDRTYMLNWPLVSDGGLGPAGGSFSDADCNVTQIGPSDVTLTTLGSWTSPHTSCTYPSGWQVDYQGLSLTLTPDLDDQELYGTQGPTYWEGSSTVSGGASGKAYVELNGFCN